MAVKNNAPKQSKTSLAKEMGVSRASLYYRPKLPEKDLKLKAEIERVLKQHKAYGHKRVALTLEINHKRALRVMKLFGLKPHRKRKVPFKRSDLNQAPMNIPNLISGTIIEARNKVWVSDFTYLPYFGKFIYLATIEDVFTRELIGWAISYKHDANLVSQALFAAIDKNPITEIIHSDQGSEYRSEDYLKLLKSLEIKPSMSEKASPWQNGYQESFYSEFKLELGHPECYPKEGELIEAIARQIYYYNHGRIHSALKCPPAIFAQRINCQQDKQILKIFNFNQQTSLIYQPIEKGQLV
jgi:transposase InsO family protein